MIGSTVRNPLSAGAWRRFWDRLGRLEAAMAVTEGEIHDLRIARLEAEVALLRRQVGVPREAETTAGLAAQAGLDGFDRSRRGP